MPANVGACLKAALAHLEAGRAEHALEAAAAAAVADIQQHQQTFLAGAPESAVLGEILEKAAAKAGVVPGVLPARTGGRRRIGYFLSSVVEGQAAGANIARFLALHDRTKFEPVVIVTEECTRRDPAKEFLTYPDAPSRRVGGPTLARMESLAPVHVLEPRGGYLDSAAAGVALARGLGLDLAVFVASPACPVQSAIAIARVAPVQVNLCTGVPLVLKGIDAIVYNNPRREAEDREFLTRRGVRVEGVETSGADVSLGLHAWYHDRSAFGVPPGATLYITVSNALARRMLAGTFAHDLGAFLAREPGAWWVGVGGGDIAPVQEVIRRVGGADAAGRAVFLGPQRDVRRFLRPSNVYLNEYPEGGGNSVLEAMGCRVPVVAMRAGTRHAECIGAELSGDDAIQNADVGAYWARASAWLHDPASRVAAADRQLRRALSRYDYPVVLRAYEACYERLVGGDGVASPSVTIEARPATPAMPVTPVLW